MTMRSASALVVVLLLAALPACSDSSPPSDAAVTPVDGVPGDATPFPDECTSAFGAPVTPSAADVGKSVVVAGRIVTVANPVRVAPAACGNEGLASLGLQLADGSVLRLTNASDTHIFCGCKMAEDAECKDFAIGATVRVKVELQHSQPGTVCVQNPCFWARAAALPLCYENGCGSDEHCPATSCNSLAKACRAAAGASCSAFVGCEEQGGVEHYCAGSGASPTCQPLGDGSQGAVCGEDGHCSCASCRCSPSNVCEPVLGPAP